MTTTALGEGTALTVTTAVPDLHHFRGSYGGKDVIPLYRDSAGTVPNLPGGLLNRLIELYGQRVTAEDVAAYVYAVLAHPGYREVFAEGLERPGPRVPVTKDPSLFREAVGLGERLLWLQTYAERYRDPAADRAARVPGVARWGL